MISEFSGKYRFLSNFYPSPVFLDGVEYPTVEHAYQAAKTVDRAERETISSALTPGKAKAKGKKVTLRYEWDVIKLSVMYDLLKQKFERSHLLKQLLLDTGDEYLEEGNTWNDTYWGVCAGVGANQLGLLLMQVRNENRD